jgi:glycosyltransferase involved in cell wall biosynthesis
VGGLRALIRDGENGLFIRPDGEGTSADLAHRLLLLAQDPAWRRKLGEAGRAEATQRYDWSRVAVQLEQLYQAAERHAATRYGRAAA